MQPPNITYNISSPSSNPAGVSETGLIQTFFDFFGKFLAGDVPEEIVETPDKSAPKPAEMSSEEVPSDINLDDAKALLAKLVELHPDLVEKPAAVTPSEPAAVTPSETSLVIPPETPPVTPAVTPSPSDTNQSSFAERYMNIKNPRERAAFYKKHQGEILKSRKIFS